MKIKFFDNNGCMRPDAICAGVYQFKIGLLDDEKNKEENKYLSLYVGESYSMALRCSSHLYEVFHTDPSYFGLTRQNLEDNRLLLIAEIYEKVEVSDETTNSERDILLREKEKAAIEKLCPLSQLQGSDRLNKDRVEIVQKAIEKLLSK